MAGMFFGNGRVRVVMDKPEELVAELMYPGSDVMRVTKRHADKVARVAKSLAPTASGRLGQSIKVQQNRNPRGRYSRGFTVIADVPYSEYVEKGRGPGKAPPKEEIQAWLNSVGASQSRSSAFLVARRIGATGTRAQPFMEPASRLPFTG
jgi:hypothetical protein